MIPREIGGGIGEMVEKTVDNINSLVAEIIHSMDIDDMYSFIEETLRAKYLMMDNSIFQEVWMDYMESLLTHFMVVKEEK